MGFVNRNDFEDWISRPLTDDEWINIQQELRGRINNFLNNLLEELIEYYSK